MTGVLSCTLEIQTPIAIPDTDEKNKKGLSYYPFYNVKKKPTIPGSELRGVVRNIYETFTGSCFSVITSNEISARDSFANPKKGLLHYNSIEKEWELFEAVVNRHNTEGVKRKECVKRKWAPPKRCEHKITDYVDVETETGKKTISRKVTVKYFTKTEKRKHYPNLNEAVKRLKAILESYKENKKNSLYLDLYDEVMPNEDAPDKYYPVFYKVLSGNVILEPAGISRKVYQHSLDYFLGEHNKCNSLDALCPACRLFGIVSDRVAYAGKVRFGDASPNNNYYQKSKPVTLKVLSSPHITAREFYSINNALTDCVGQNDYADRPIWDYDDDGVSIRGRKFYLHNQRACNGSENLEKASSEYSVNKKNVTITNNNVDMNATMELMDKGTFTFKVYYNNLTRQELDVLVWSLTLGNYWNEQSKMFHKIGHGKPLGLGSVKITVDREKSFTRKLSNGYEMVPVQVNNPDSPEAELVYEKDEQSIEDMKVICRFDYVAPELPIGYPLGNKDGKSNSMNWFVNNKSSISQKNGRYYQVLHPIHKDPKKLLIKDN